MMTGDITRQKCDQVKLQYAMKQAGRLIGHDEQTSKWELANSEFSMPLNMHTAFCQRLYQQPFRVPVHT